MKILTLDFETYYSREYSLTKMTTEEYIRDPRFQIIMCGLRDVDGEYHILDGADGIKSMRAALLHFGAEKYPILCHNTQFDAAIVNWVLGITKCPLYLDTMAMASALGVRSAMGSAALSKVAAYFALPAKGDAVHNMLGVRREDMDKQQFAKYAEYCCNDVQITFNAFNLMEKDYPRSELLLIDRTVRMYVEPRLVIDTAVCDEGLDDDRTKLATLLRATGVTTEVLMSNEKFAEQLAQHVTVPVKTSLRTGKRAYALAKNDEDFHALRTHENPLVRMLIAARLAAKSTMDRTRFEAFKGIASRHNGLLPVPLWYYGAHTGRMSGKDSINLQNLKRGSLLRKALRAPPGHYVIAADQAQIEARVNACWSGQEDLVEDFRNGIDVYSKFASFLYSMEVTKDTHPKERFIGKTCILGLGYSMGAARLMDTVKISQPIDSDFAQGCVDTYRKRYPMIKKNWYRGTDALNSMSTGVRFDWGPVYTERDALVMPNGLKLYYPDLCISTDGETQYRERVRANRVGGAGEWTRIYGAKLVENVVQGLSRIALMDQLVSLSLKWQVVLTVHDEIVFIVPKSAVEEAVDHIGSVMRTAPKWMPDLPVEVEIKYGDNYADCK